MQRGEIYAMGIKMNYLDGTSSPVYTIKTSVLSNIVSRICKGLKSAFRRTGPGLLEYMDTDNVIPYSGGNIDDLTEHLKMLWTDRVPSNQRNVSVWTGEAGRKMFDSYIQDKYGLSTMEKIVSKILPAIKIPQYIINSEELYALTNLEQEKEYTLLYGNTRVWNNLIDNVIHGSDQFVNSGEA